MLLTVVPWSHTRHPEPRHDEHECEVHAVRCQGHCTVSGDNPRSWGRRIAHLRTSVVPYLFFYPLESYQQHACARGIALLASCVGRAVRVFVAAASPRPGWKHALRTPRGRRSGRPSAQQARATHWATAQPRALAASDFWQGALRVLCTPRPLGCAPRQSRIAPPCPADASVSALTARGMGRASLLCAGGQGTLPASGKASCARCARRDRSGRTRGQATLLR